MFDGQMWYMLLDGFKMTLIVFVATLVFSLPLGIFLAVLNHFLAKPFQIILRIYVYIFRGTPLLLQMMFVFFGLPLVGIVLGRLEAALLTMILNYAAYYLEIFRGGLNSIDSGQFEALKVLSISKWQGMRWVILPQVWRNTLPSVANEVITLIKDTSLVYILGLNEVLKTGRTLANQSASLLPYINVAIIYLVFTGIVSLGLRKLEERSRS